MQMPETGRVTLRNVQQQSLNLSARHLAWNISTPGTVITADVAGLELLAGKGIQVRLARTPSM